MKLKPAWIALGAAVLILIGVVILVVTAMNKPVTEETKTPTEQVQVERTLTGKTAAEDKEDVLAAAIALLQAAGAPSNDADFEKLMKSIEAGEASMPEELASKIRVVDKLANEDGIDSTIYQTLVTFGAFANKSSGAESITPLYDNAAEGIVLDQETGIAYVPTTLFVNSGSGVNGFSMEFVYVDGEWFFSPYMTLDELRLALVFQGAGE